MRKTDYQKGLTAGLSLAKRMPKRYRVYTHSYRNEIDALVRKASDEYGDTIGELVCPFTGEPSYMRTSWYRDGVRDGITYGHGIRFMVCHYKGQPGGAYNVADLAEDTVYTDPCWAWKRSWELDPQGHKYKALDALYINGACERFNLNDVYGLNTAEVA